VDSSIDTEPDFIIIIIIIFIIIIRDEWHDERYRGSSSVISRVQCVTG